MDDKIILLVIPILLIQLILTIINLINLGKKTKTKYLTKIVWVFILLLFSYIGNIAYLVLEGNDNEDGN